MCSADRSAPGEELNPGEETAPRDSASAIVLRDTRHGLEVLLVKRNPRARFMGGAWVFPGGASGEEDPGPEHTALRELEEEAGIALGGPAELVAFSRWITPPQVRVRFDTRFFVARAPAGARAVPDGSECVEARWFTPAAALEAGARDEILLVFPTIRHLEQLAEPESVEEVLALARARPVEPVEPRIAPGEDGAPRVLLPGEPGFDEA